MEKDVILTIREIHRDNGPPVWIVLDERPVQYKEPGFFTKIWRKLQQKIKSNDVYKHADF